MEPILCSHWAFRCKLFGIWRPKGHPIGDLNYSISREVRQNFVTLSSCIFISSSGNLVGEYWSRLPRNIKFGVVPGYFLIISIDTFKNTPVSWFSTGVLIGEGEYCQNSCVAQVNLWKYQFGTQDLSRTLFVILNFVSLGISEEVQTGMATLLIMDV